MFVGTFAIFKSAAHCNFNSARNMPGPGVEPQRVVDRVDRRDLRGVPLQHAVHHFYDSGEGKFAGQEALHRHLVRGVEHRGCRAAGPERGVGQVETGEPAPIHRLEIEGARAVEVERRDRAARREAEAMLSMKVVS